MFSRMGLLNQMHFFGISGIAVGFAYIPLAIAAYLFMASYAVFLFSLD